MTIKFKKLHPKTEDHETLWTGSTSKNYLLLKYYNSIVALISNLMNSGKLYTSHSILLIIIKLISTFWTKLAPNQPWIGTLFWKKSSRLPSANVAIYWLQDQIKFLGRFSKGLSMTIHVWPLLSTSLIPA